MMSKPSAVRKGLFKNAPAEVRKLSAQSHREQRQQAREEFKQTEQDAGRWNQQKPRI